MIKKEFQMGSVILQFRISDGVAILTTNDPRITHQIYLQSFKADKPNINWNWRLSAFIEKFPNKKENEILELIKKDLEEANKKEKELRNLKLKLKEKAGKISVEKAEKTPTDKHQNSNTSSTFVSTKLQQINIKTPTDKCSE